ncbi:MAG: DUF368 domain-containing protein [Demequina sp.]
MTSPSTPPARGAGWGTRVLNMLRGGLIGMAETIPGVSGGTIALITGVYESILTSAGHLITGLRIVVVDGVRGRGVARAREDLAQVRWGVLIPLGLGMVLALLATARVMESLVEDYPVIMRALFFGLVLASLAVPYRLAAHAEHARRPQGRWSGSDVTVALVAAVVAAIIVSLPRTDLVASPVVLVPAGAIAISALVLPGLSGSFLLLTMGLYEPTLGAVNDRDLGYLAFFAIGCIIGLISVVKVLQWLLEHHRRLTLVVLTGVMAGSLRALWPWLTEDNQLLAPSGDVLWVVIAALVGVVAVVTVLVVEQRIAGEAGAFEDQPIDSDDNTHR